MLRGHALFRLLSVAAFLACYATILIGGNVIASDSGLGCPDWPTCHGALVPALGGATAVEFSHRLAALVLSLLVFGLSIAALIAERRRPAFVRLSLASLAIVVSEAILGGVVVASQLLVALVLVHFAVATVLFALLLLIAVLANYRELPPSWRLWAARAVEERPEPPAAEGDAPAKSPSPAGPAGAQRAPSALTDILR